MSDTRVQISLRTAIIVESYPVPSVVVAVKRSLEEESWHRNESLDDLRKIRDAINAALREE